MGRLNKDGEEEVRQINQDDDTLGEKRTKNQANVIITIQYIRNITISVKREKNTFKK